MAIADGNIESPELLELIAGGTVFGYASTDKSNITITDVSNKHITVTGPATVAEGNGITYRFSLPAGVTTTSDITIALAADGASTATLADLTGMPAVKILSGQQYVDVTFNAKADMLIEADETLTLNASAATFTFSQPVSFNITDGDLAAAGISLSVAPGSVAEGGSAIVKATLTGGVTAAADITVALSRGERLPCLLPSMVHWVPSPSRRAPQKVRLRFPRIPTCSWKQQRLWRSEERRRRAFP